MNKIEGKINVYPWLNIEVEAQLGTRQVNFLVDTGFSGELAIPRSYRSLFGTSSDTLTARFADGHEEETIIVQCRVNWLDGPRAVTAIYIDGDNPLLGMELMNECLVTLEIEHNQGEITIETI